MPRSSRPLIVNQSPKQIEEMDAYGNTVDHHHVTDFGLLHDFMDESNFEQFIDLIRGETNDPIVKFCPNYDCEHINGCLVDYSQFAPTTQEDIFGFNSVGAMSNPNSSMGNIGIYEDLKGDVEDDDENDEEESSATTTTTTNTTTTPTKRATKADRSRTLVSERRRRGRMKEKLYALRSLVPNITKMDKASIVGDAVLYVQDLQMQAKKLRAEIAGLESSLGGTDKFQGGLVENPKKFKVTNINHPICKNIIQMDVFQVEERGFYVRLVCSKGQGVAVSLYKALESLTSFTVQSSNMATNNAERFILTFTLHVRECETEMNLPNLKLWVTGALLNQGFEFKSHLP